MKNANKMLLTILSMAIFVTGCINLGSDTHYPDPSSDLDDEDYSLYDEDSDNEYPDPSWRRPHRDMPPRWDKPRPEFGGDRKPEGEGPNRSGPDPRPRRSFPGPDGNYHPSEEAPPSVREIKEEEDKKGCRIACNEEGELKSVPSCISFLKQCQTNGRIKIPELDQVIKAAESHVKHARSLLTHNSSDDYFIEGAKRLFDEHVTILEKTISTLKNLPRSSEIAGLLRTLGESLIGKRAHFEKVKEPSNYKGYYREKNPYTGAIEGGQYDNHDSVMKDTTIIVYKSANRYINVLKHISSLLKKSECNT